MLSVSCKLQMAKARYPDDFRNYLLDFITENIGMIDFFNSCKWK